MVTSKDPSDDIAKLDWLHNAIDQGIALPWEGNGWAAFEEFYGTKWDIDLTTPDADPGEKTHALAEVLEECTPEQIDAITSLVVIAIKTTRSLCERPRK